MIITSSIMPAFIEEVRNNEYVAIFVSCLLGFGLASMFRTVCKSNDCVIVRGPSIKEVQKNVYKIDDKCYKYNPKSTTCD